MEAQINTFNKGINSDLAPMYHQNGMWAFPTINARFYNNGKGFTVTNIDGNTNNDNTSDKGAEIVLKSRYALIGAYEIGGIAFLCSVSMDKKKLEIGCFPSPLTSGGFERTYKALYNINDTTQECNFPNSLFSWNTNALLQIEGKVEYDNTINLYICSGTDLLRVINNAFDIKTGIYLDHRKYKRNTFEEATRNIKTQSLILTRHIISNDDIVINETGGTLKYGRYIFYLRYKNLTYDTTKWVFETVPINIGKGTYDNNDNEYIQGSLTSNTGLSTQYISITIPVTDAYTDVEVGYVFKGYDNDTLKEVEEKGILNGTFMIIEGQTTLRIDIQTIASTAVSEWDGEENIRTIELVPKAIWAINNILYQANMSNEILDINLVREFFKRVKLKCKVKHGEIPMPTDNVVTDFDSGKETHIVRLVSSQTILGVEYKYHNEDNINNDIETETTGNLKIILDESPVSIDGTYPYSDKQISSVIYANGYEYIIDTTTYTELVGFNIYSDEAGENFTIVDNNQSPVISYIYESISVYNKIYPATSDNLTLTDTIKVIDNNIIHITIANLTIDDDYYYVNITIEEEDIFNSSYRIYDLSGSKIGTINLTINYNEIKFYNNTTEYVFGENIKNIIQNDAYYSRKEHILEDIGYFGGEIYAFSLLGIDKYGNKYGPFPCTGIDHYYANKLQDLEYNAYEDDETGKHYSSLTDDENSDYTINDDRKFIKNQQGIYRFPCRSNYVKALDDYDRLIKEEDLSYNIDDYDNDIFNLTQRIKQSTTGYNSVLNIFKIAFDFTEAYNWITQTDSNNNETETNNLITLRNNIVKIIVLRAERKDDADNLIAQGIIQKPNTIIPYPKFYEFETLDFSETTKGIYSHNSFEKLISYNFDMIYNNCCKKDTKWDSNTPLRLNLHGQLGNSSIKMREDDNSYHDVSYPDGIKDIKNIWNQYIFRSKSFIYSGKYSFHNIDYKWDSWYRTRTTKHYNTSSFEAPPALGAITFSSHVGDSAEMIYYFNNCIDPIWGEMGSQVVDASTLGYKQYNMYPQQNIFLDYIYSDNRKEWYYYDSAATGHWFTYYKAQYTKIIQHPLLVTGGGIKIPFFKGYMPCLHRAGRRNVSGSNKFAYTRMYTTRCMYHPYDLTRSFISPDITFGQYNINLDDIKYIKPLRKTIYSGMDGVEIAGITEIDTALDNIYFKSDCWKTFFARPNEMTLFNNPWAKHYYDGDYVSDEKEYDDYIDIKNGWSGLWNTWGSFFTHRNISDSGIGINQNPIQLLHSIKKYFKIESQRECMPIGNSKIINSISPKDINIAVPSSGKVDIDANKHNIYSYLNYAYDFTDGASLGNGNNSITMSDINSTTYMSGSNVVIDKYLKGKKQHMLWAAMDIGNDNLIGKGSFFASNRTFKIIPYIALELKAIDYNPENEFPSLSYEETDYRYMYDYTEHFYDRYVRLSQYKALSPSYKITNDSIVGQEEDSLIVRKANNGQYTNKDIYIDYNYEDLTLVNLYKVNPENIIDITDFYTYYTSEYYEIGELLSSDVIGISNENVESREYDFGRGDCFLDRTYIKHTTWLPTNVGLGTVAYGSDGLGLIPSHNWEVTGSKKNYENYMSYFTSATSSYAHGTTIGIITENRYNIALRGTINSLTMNSYPMCENMDNYSSETSGFNSRAMRHNLFLVYPEAIASSNTYYYMENLYYNQGYHKVLGSIFYAIENNRISYLRNNYPNRIRWSYYANEGSYADGWRQFDIANYYDYTQKYGEIKRIMDYYGILISFMDNGILQHIYEGTDVQVSEEQILSVGGSRVLGKESKLISDIGLSHKHALVKTEKGIYGIDTNKDTLWRVQQGESSNLGLVSLNKTAGINEWYKEYLHNIKTSLNVPIDVTDVTTKIDDDIFNGIGVSAAYDKDYNEVLFTFINDYKNWTICYSEILDSYTSLYSFDPYIYININKDLYSVKHNSLNGYEARYIYRHNNKSSYKQNFYNSFYNNDFAISFIANGNSQDRNTSPFAKQFQAQSIESQQKPFTYIEYITKDQRAYNKFIDEDKWWSNPEYLSHHWQVPIQIDNTSVNDDIDMFSLNSSMLGTWLKTTLYYNPSIDNTEIFINNILTTFNISQS